MEEAIVSNNPIPFLRMGSGEPLVLLHGFSSCKEAWFKQFKLAKQFDLIIPDLRGHGNNHTLEGISIENFAKDVLSLLNFLNIESAHICGYSMGGIVAQEIYRQAPEKCKSLVFACTTHYFSNDLGGIIRQLYKVQSFIVPPFMRKILAVRSCFFSWSMKNVGHIEKCLKPNVKVMYKAIDAIVGVDNRSLLPKITVPTLVIGARYDSIIPVIIPMCMKKQIPNSELVILNKAGHLAKVEMAKEFNQALLNFFSKHLMTSVVN